LEDRHDDPLLLAHLRAITRAIEARKLPPAFAFMFDHAWEVVLRLWPLAEALLGQGCVLEPSFAAFKLNHKKTANHTSYVGNNFSKPHRDYSFADAIDGASGDVKVLSVWMPLNDVTLHNGCMYAVPRSLDAAFADPVGFEGLSEPAVPVTGVTPLAPHPAGTFMCWTGNTIHWGSGCEASGAADPRQSFALVFRRKDARLSVAEASLTREAVAGADTATRLGMVRSALGFFRHWYPEADLAKYPLPWAPAFSANPPPAASQSSSQNGTGGGKEIAVDKSARYRAGFEQVPP
jgi:hypothetical protein